MTPENLEFRTVTVTPASMTRRKRFARKRAEQLAVLKSEGWEIVDIEPERIFRRGDKVTVQRPATPVPPPARKPDPAPFEGKYFAIVVGIIVLLLLAVVIDAVT